MTPIVFCASFVPWASDMSDAAPIWPQRKSVRSRFAESPAVARCTSQVPVKATRPAMTGASSAGMRIFCATPPHSTPEKPSAAIVAPMRPPKSAWLDDDGRPNNQVSTFQTIAPVSPHSTMSMRLSPSTPVRSTIPDPTVRATSIERNAPTRLSDADSATAGLGFRAPVATDGAIAFAVSWKPFVKSKASATTTTIARMAVSCIAPVSTTHPPASKRRSSIEA